MAKSVSKGVYWFQAIENIHTLQTGGSVVSHAEPGKNLWNRVEISDDGTVMAGFPVGLGYIWIYKNGSWEKQEDAGERNWRDIALSPAGNVIYAITYDANYVFKREL